MTGGGSVWRIIRVCCFLATVHSLLASKQAKDLVSRGLGPRRRNGLYRFFYVVQSTICFTSLTWWLRRLPDRELYRVRGRWVWLLRIGQGIFLAMGFAGVRVIGLAQFNGLSQLRGFQAGENPEMEAEAQGPPIGVDGEMEMAGPFRFTRHPGNLAPIGVLAFSPRMTINLFTLTVMTMIYSIVGSLHEEYRHRARYGAAYLRYQQGVPFLLPTFRATKTALPR